MRLAVALFFLIPISKIVNFNELFTIDPWYHMAMTKNMEPVQLFSNNVQLYDKIEIWHYPTFMRTLLYEFHLITNADYIQIYKYFWFIAKFFLLIVMFLFVKSIYFSYFNIKLKKSEELLFILLALWHSYFWTRAWITFPENFALLFHALILLFCTKFLIQNRSIYLFLIALSCSISIYYHNPSFVMVFLIALWFIVGLFIQNKKYFLRNILYILIPFIFLSLPVINILAIEYIRQFTENIGTNIQSYWDITRFIAPSLYTYIQYASEFIVLFWILWFLRLFIKKQNRQDFKYIETLFPLFFLCIGALILTNWVRFNINVPTDRMQWYFIIPIIIFAYIWLMKFMKNRTIQLKIIITFLIFIISFNVVVVSKWWFKLRKGEIQVGDYLNTHFSPDRKYFFDEEVNYNELQFPYYKNIVSNTGNVVTWDWIITYKTYDTLKLVFQDKYLRVYEQ